MGIIACPCCGYGTLSERAAYEICAICFWEDDGQDDDDADEVSDPNHLTLTQARHNFLAFGACREADRSHVRSPHPDEKPIRQFSRS